MRAPLVLGIAAFIFATLCQPGAAQSGAANPRRVFVLHSGMHIALAHPDKNAGAKHLQKMLLARGVPASDIIVLDSPFPEASWRDPIPREGLLIYLGCTDPASQASHDAYLRLDSTLRNHKITAQDNLVWIGHSAGGQVGMSMVHLAHNLGKYPKLAKARPYHFDMIITLGTPVGSNPVPSDVKLRHYYSEGDTMIYGLAKHGAIVTASVKSKVVFRPCHELGENAKIRVFHNIEHADWDSDDLVLRRLLNEFNPAHRPAWQRTHADLPTGMGLAQLVARSLESTWHISLEQLQH
jgi:hypothetical protein